MSVSYRVARGALARGSNFRRLSQWTLPVSSSVVTTNVQTTSGNSNGVKYMSTSSSGGSLLTKLAKENPYKDVVRYEFKNRKWNLQHVDFYSEALAVGLLETGLQPGDVVLSWLPSHFSESVSTYGCIAKCCLCELQLFALWSSFFDLFGDRGMRSFWSKF